MVFMAHWQASSPRQPPKTKAELRQMLTDAVRNTQPSVERQPERLSEAKKTKKIGPGAGS